MRAPRHRPADAFRITHLRRRLRQPRLAGVRLLRYRTRARADAEDLTQQTFERALRAWSRYDPSRGSVATWLLAIARNLLIDQHRGDRSDRQRPLDAPDGDHDLAQAHDRPDLGLEPELEQALASLGAREHEIVALRFGGDLNGPEIAELTGLKLANVQQILSRSLRKMRAVLEETEPVRAQAAPADG